MRIIKYFAPYKGSLFLVVALLFVQALCDLALPRYTAGIVDVGILHFGIQDASSGQEELFARAISSQDYSILGFDPQQTQLQYLLAQGSRMLALTLVGAFAAAGVSFLASRTSAGIARNLRDRLFAKVVSFSDAEVQSFSAASLITRSTNDVQQIQTVSFVVMRMVLFAPIMALGGIAMVLSTNVSLAWIIALAIAVVLACIVVLMAVAMPKFRIMQKLVDRVNLVAREILTGLPVIRSFGRQNHEQERFEGANAELMRTQLFTNRAMAFMQPVVQLVLNGTSVLIVWVAAGQIEAGAMQTGEMIAFINYAVVVITSFMMMSMVAIVLPRADVAAGRIDEVLACESSISDPEGACADTIGTGAASLEFDKVSFSYGADAAPVLDGVSFSIPAGSRAAIVGSTGSGKSSILKLLLRFWDVTQGCVRIGGVDVRDIPQKALRSQLSYVPQQSFLFSGTIASNIAYADPGLSEERMRDAAAFAQALDFIEQKDDAFESVVSQGGTNLSGGQRQRLSIARALAKPARVYLFDDSFSALDYATDSALRRSLAQATANATVVIVAQRIASVRDCDTIIVLDNGQVAGQGTHEQLLADCSVYREIATSQLSSEELEGAAS